MKKFIHPEGVYPRRLWSLAIVDVIASHVHIIPHSRRWSFNVERLKKFHFIAWEVRSMIRLYRRKEIKELIISCDSKNHILYLKFHRFVLVSEFCSIEVWGCQVLHRTTQMVMLLIIVISYVYFLFKFSFQTLLN